MSDRYSALTSPLIVRGKVFKSRFMYPVAQVHFLQGPEYYPADPVVSYFERQAKNGQALIMAQDLTSPTQRTQKGHDSKHFANYDLYDRTCQNYFTQFAHFIHCQGSYLGTELSSVDLRLNYSVNDPDAPPAPRPGGPSGGNDEEMQKMRKMMEAMMRDGPEGTSPGTQGFPGSPNPRTIYFTKEKIQEYIDYLCERAKLYKSFGYDAGLFEMGRDFYIGEFLSETVNRRTDEYGGSFENRMRFAVEVVKGVRKAVGDDFILLCNAPVITDGEPGAQASPMMAGGLNMDEAVQFINAITPYVDIFRLHGMEDDPSKCDAAELAAKLKARGVKVKICVNTPYMDLDKINAIIKDGKADLIASARMFICNENMGEMLKNGNGEDLNPCLDCGVCRGSSPMGDWMSHCTISPQLGMDHRVARLITPVELPKKVAVIGGGPAGMKCALWLQERGHTPVIFEASGELGGQIKTARYPDFKWKLERYLDFLIAQVDRHRIDVRLNTPATPEMIKAMGFDTIIAATGAVPQKPNIEGAELAKWDAVNIYGRESEIGKCVVVIGGSSAPAEAAVYLKQLGHDVTLLCRKNMIGYDLNPIRARGQINREAIGAGIDIITNVSAKKIETDKVTYTDADGAEHTIECDDVLAAGGMKGNSEFAVSFYNAAPEFYAIGDCKDSGNLRTALRDAYTTAIRV